MHILPLSPASSEPPVTPSTGDDAAPDETFIALLGAAMAEAVDTTTSHQSDGELDGGGVGDTTNEPIDVGELLAAGLVNLELPADTAGGLAGEPTDGDLSSEIEIESTQLDPIEHTSDATDELETAEAGEGDADVEVDPTGNAIDSGAIEAGDGDEIDPVVEGDPHAVGDERTTSAPGTTSSEVAADAAQPSSLGEFRIPAWIIAQHEEQVQAEMARVTGAAGAAATGTPAATAAETSQPMPPVSEQMAATPTTVDGDNPWEQLANVVRPLRQLPDGSHRIALQLRPAELGVVHLEVAFEDGRLSLRAVAENLATREVLAAALPELRAELSKSGIDLGSLDVGDQTFGADAGDDGTRAQPPLGDGAPAAPAAFPSPESTDDAAPSVHAGGLDLTL